MKKTLVIIMVSIASIALTAGIVKAASGVFDSLTVGKQGVGGVTYFNGTIINNTTTGGVDNPVTLGDNVRIDGRVYRGATAGTSDKLPFIVNDNMEVIGTLTVAGLSGSGIVSTDNIANGAVTNAKLATSVVATANLASDSVTSVKIADATIATADIADSAVTTAKIASGAVTQTKENYSSLQTTSANSPNYDIVNEVTITTGESTLLCIFSGYIMSSTYHTATAIFLIVDGTQAPNSTRVGSNGETNDFFTISTNALVNVSAGSHTVQVGWYTTPGATATMGTHTLDVIELKK